MLTVRPKRKIIVGQRLDPKRDQRFLQNQCPYQTSNRSPYPLSMEPSESSTNPQELDGTVYKFVEAWNTAFKLACPTGKPRGRKKPPH